MYFGKLIERSFCSWFRYEYLELIFITICFLRNKTFSYLNKVFFLTQSQNSHYTLSGLTLDEILVTKFVCIMHLSINP